MIVVGKVKLHTFTPQSDLLPGSRLQLGEGQKVFCLRYRDGAGDIQYRDLIFTPEGLPSFSVQLLPQTYSRIRIDCRDPDYPPLTIYYGLLERTATGWLPAFTFRGCPASPGYKAGASDILARPGPGILYTPQAPVEWVPNPQGGLPISLRGYLPENYLPECSTQLRALRALAAKLLVS